VDCASDEKREQRLGKHPNGSSVRLCMLAGKRKERGLLGDAIKGYIIRGKGRHLKRVKGSHFLTKERGGGPSGRQWGTPGSRRVRRVPLPKPCRTTIVLMGVLGGGGGGGKRGEGGAGRLGLGKRTDDGNFKGAFSTTEGVSKRYKRGKNSTDYPKRTQTGGAGVWGTRLNQLTSVGSILCEIVDPSRWRVARR